MKSINKTYQKFPKAFRKISFLKLEEELVSHTACTADLGSHNMSTSQKSIQDQWEMMEGALTDTQVPLAPLLF